MDTVAAGGAAHPNALVVLLGGLRPLGIDFVGNTGNLQETAALFSGSGAAGAPFQSIQQLLSGDSLQAGHIAEGVDGFGHLVGQLPGDGLVADAAAVHHSNIHIQTHPVKQVVQGIGAEVAGVGLLGTNQTVAVCVIVVQRQSGFADFCSQPGVHIGHPCVLDGGNLRIHRPCSPLVQGRCQLVAHHLGDFVALVVLFDFAVLVFDHLGQLGIADEVGGDGAGFSVNDHHADGIEVFAGLGQHHGLAVLAGHFPAGDGGVGVTVDEGIQAGNLGDDLLAGPGAGGGIVTQMPQTNDNISIFGHSINGSLHIRSQSRAVLAAGDSVDVIAIFILEVGGGGLGKGLGGCNAHEGHLQAAGGLEGVGGIQNGLALDAVLFPVEVAGDVGEIGSFHIGQRLLHAVVELMVAQGSNIVTGGIHQRDDGVALVHGSVGGSLNMVTGICQQDIALAVGFLQLRLDAGNDIIAQGVVDVGVDIVGVEDDHILLRCGSRGFRSRGLGSGRGSLGRSLRSAAEEAQTQNHRQHHCKCFMHHLFLLSGFIFSLYHSRKKKESDSLYAEVFL